MLYLADKAAFSVNLSRLRSANVNVFWVNPITGVSTPMGQEAGASVKHFSTPDGWEDALLVLEDAGNVTDAPLTLQRASLDHRGVLVVYGPLRERPSGPTTRRVPLHL